MKDGKNKNKEVERKEKEENKLIILEKIILILKIELKKINLNNEFSKNRNT